MRILLLVAHGRPAPGSGRDAAVRLDEDHALALAAHMRDGGRLAPLLATEKGGRLAAEARRRGLPHITFGAGLSGFLGAMWGIRRWLGARPFFILAFGDRALSMGRKIRWLGRKRPVAIAPAFLVRPPDNVRHLSDQADFIFCGSEILARKLADGMGDATGRCRIRPPGIAPEALPPVRGEHFVFGMDQSLEPRSGALTVVRAMAAIWQREDLPPWEMRMYGRGPRFDEILSNARELGVQSRLALLDEQDRAEALAQCSAWLAPGTSDSEPPQTLWQGFARGIPVIASSSPLHMERLGAGCDCALLVPGGDPQALANAMIRLLVHPELGGELVGKAELGGGRFRLEDVAADWAADIESLWGSRVAAS